MPIPFIVKRARNLSFESVESADVFSKFVHGFMMRKAEVVWSHLEKYMTGKKVLDVGMGSGSISYFVKKKNFEVTSVDVADLSIYEDMKPVVYDGNKLPFKDNQFDVAVIVHVLHHCADGIEVLSEALRVSKRVIFIEDTFTSKFEEELIQIEDALTNFEFRRHDFRSVETWKKIIKKCGWKVVANENWTEWLVSSPYSRYTMFVIEK